MRSDCGGFSVVAGRLGGRRWVVVVGGSGVGDGRSVAGAGRRGSGRVYRVAGAGRERRVGLARRADPAWPPIRQGALFAYSLLPAGDYALGASAPGYQTIGGDENGSTAPGTGAPFSIPPGPPILPAGAAVSTHLAADVRLVPPDPCTPPGPPVLPALSGAIRDAGSGRLIPGATLTLTPTAGQQPPGPPERLGGLFTFPSLAAGPYTLTVSAPGYRAITGIPYICPPGPPVLPSGASLSFTTALDIQLVR